MMLGPVGGAAVRLAAAAEELAVAEGIESGLSAQQATGIPTWAAMSTSGLKTLILPPLPLAAEIVIAADNDAAGDRAARKAADRWIAEGRTVKIAKPPTEGDDFNDILKGAKAGVDES